MSPYRLEMVRPFHRFVRRLDVSVCEDPSREEVNATGYRERTWRENRRNNFNDGPRTYSKSHKYNSWLVYVIRARLVRAHQWSKPVVLLRHFIPY